MKVALIGYGKMGHTIEKILIDRGHSVPLIIDVDNKADLNPTKLAEVDVAIEFSTPDAAFDNIIKCLEAGVPLVCGTTAWLDRYGEVEALCNKVEGSFFYASNFSVGVNILFNINRRLAELMNGFSEYDVTMEEVHHTMKKDAPSGTAITLAEGIVDNLNRKEKWFCGTTTEADELEIASIRRSVVPGIHTVTYESETDLISITHNAKSRNGFAMGAVLAAEFLKDKKGIYSMNDLLGL